MSLTEKLLEIQKRVRGLHKKERSSQGYTYVGSTQVLAAVRDAMDDVGVLLLVEVVEHETQLAAMSTRSGGAVHWVGLRLKFTWVDAENPSDTLSCMWWSDGIDSAEKGVGKALTYGEKYFLLKFFHIPTSDEDPDRGGTPVGYVGGRRPGYDDAGYPTQLRTLAVWVQEEYGVARDDVKRLCEQVAEELWGASPDDWHALTEEQVVVLAEAIERRLSGETV